MGANVASSTCNKNYFGYDFFLFLVLYYFKEIRRQSQLFSVNFMKKLNKYSIGLFFCLGINSLVGLGIVLRFHLTCKGIQSFSKI